MTYDTFRLPDTRSPTRNEIAWLSMLRDITAGKDVAPTLAAIQALQKVLPRN